LFKIKNRVFLHDTTDASRASCGSSTKLNVLFLHYDNETQSFSVLLQKRRIMLEKYEFAVRTLSRTSGANANH